MSTLFYPIDLDSGEYGNACVIFKAYKRNEKQATNPTGSGSAQMIPSNIPSATPLDGLENILEGIINPITSIIKENMFEKYQGSRKGGLTNMTMSAGQEIVLYVPGDIGVAYQARWEEQDAPISGGIAKAYDEFSDDKAFGSVMAALGNAIGATALSAAQGNTAADVFMSTTGYAPNPQKQMFFRDMEFRRFQFTYHFYAKSEDEAKAIQQIIWTFKKSMHPTIADAGFLYEYPDWFEVKYYLAEGKENPFLHKFKKAILEGVDVKYSPEGLFVSHVDGSPTHTILTLQFKELEILTQKDFETADTSY